MPFIDGCQRLHGLCVAMIPSASSAFPICRLCIEHTSAQSTCCICRRKQCWSRHCTKRSYSIDGTTLCVKCWSNPTLAAYVFGRPPPPDGPEGVIAPGEPITDLHLGSESSSSQETSGGDLESNADTSGTMVLWSRSCNRGTERGDTSSGGEGRADAVLESTAGPYASPLS